MFTMNVWQFKEIECTEQVRSRTGEVLSTGATCHKWEGTRFAVIQSWVNPDA